MIKKILLLMLFSASSFAMSFGQAQEVYSRVTRSNDFSIAPRLVLSNSPDVNASSGGFRITINKGMLRFAHNSDELAIVLGHELAHYTLHHRQSTPSNEYAADALGAMYATKARYSSCLGAQLIRRFHNEASSTHPDSESRYNRLKC